MWLLFFSPCNLVFTWQNKGMLVLCLLLVWIANEAGTPGQNVSIGTCRLMTQAGTGPPYSIHYHLIYSDTSDKCRTGVSAKTMRAESFRVNSSRTCLHFVTTSLGKQTTICPYSIVVKLFLMQKLSSVIWHKFHIFSTSKHNSFLYLCGI